MPGARGPRQSCRKCTELELRISILESKIEALPSKIEELREISHEGSTATETVAKKAPQQTDIIADGEEKCIHPTEQNVSTEHWQTMGGRPKNKNRTVLTSTPVHCDATRATLRHHNLNRARYTNYNRMSSHMENTQPIRLQNRFECLRDQEVGPPSEQAHNNKRARGRGKSQFSTPPHPTTLVLGDATVRHLKGKRMIVCCLPNASISDAESSILKLISAHKTIKQIIVHVGANDIFKEQLFVQDSFRKLFSDLRKIGIQAFISGPLPASGSFAFTRLFSLNTWLSKTCFSLGMNFIDNFNLFWNRREFFKPKSTELSWIGTRVLADHYRLSLQHAIFLQPTGRAADKCLQTDPGVDNNKNSKPKQPPLQAQQRYLNKDTQPAMADCQRPSEAGCQGPQDTGQPQISALSLQTANPITDNHTKTAPSTSRPRTIITETVTEVVTIETVKETLTKDNTKCATPKSQSRSLSSDLFERSLSSDLFEPSPSPPPMDFPKSMQRLLPMATLSFSSPNCPRKVVYPVQPQPTIRQNCACMGPSTGSPSKKSTLPCNLMEYEGSLV